MGNRWYKRKGTTYPFLDNYRGMLISLMILANFIVYFSGIPDWFNHADPYKGVYFVDFGAPLFFFIIGVSYGISFKRRLERNGFKKTCGHFLFRYGLLWLFGLFGVWVVAEDLVFGWNVLMAIGLAGSYSLPFMFLKPVWRLITGLILLTVYQFVLLPTWTEQVLASDMGGYLGAVSWSGLILISSFWQKPVEEGKKRRLGVYYFGFASAALGLGAVLNQFYPASKHLASLPYMLYSYALAVCVLLIFDSLAKIPQLRLDFLNIMGKNALTMYIISGLLILLFQALLKPDIRIPFVIVFALLNYALCLSIAFLLHKKALFIKL
jgi:predicted acyltransferase